MRRLVSLIFVSILLVPAGVWMAGLDFGSDMDRIGLPVPHFQPQAFFDKDYYQAFDQYFSDSFSLRGPLIFAKNWLDYHVFRTTDSSEVHVGVKGWLYDRNSIRDYMRAACADKSYAEYLALELHAIEKIIEASGRRFFFTVAPNKSTVYPEFVGIPPQVDGRGSSLYEMFLASMSAQPMRSFSRLDEPLREAKKKDVLLYEKTDSHWNSLGAMVAAENILQKIFEGQQETPALHFKPVRTADSENLKRILLGISAIKEDRPIEQFGCSKGSDQPSALVYCDSSMSGLLPYLVDNFGSIDVIRTDNVPSRRHGEDLKSYSIILLERAEAKLGTLHLDLNRIYSKLGAETLVQDIDRLSLKTVVPVSHVSLDYQAEALAIKSLGADSAYKLASVPASNDESFRVLKLVIESSRPDTMTVQYMTEEPIFTRKSLKSGRSEIFLPLPFQQSVSVQINPGKNVGLFVLQSAELLSVANRPAKVPPFKDDFVAARGGQEGVSSSISAAGSAEVTVRGDSSGLHTVKGDSLAGDSAAEQGPVYVKKDFVRKPMPLSADTSGDGSLQMLTAVDLERGSIVVNDYEEGRIFQRREVGASLVVSGSYGGLPGGIEARVVRGDTANEVVPWTMIDASPKNGIFLGMLNGVPQGGWYNIQVRSSKDHSVSSHGSHKWGVGILVACLGQSNMKEWFHTGTDFRAHPLLRKYTVKGWSELGTRGNAAIAFGNRMIERLRIPVGLLDYSQNGSGLRKEADWGMGYWEDTAPGSIYDQFVTGVSAAGGFVEFVIWTQGEADAARGTVTETEYRSSLESFIANQVRMDVGNGSSQQNLPFLIVMMIKRPGGKDEPHQAIRNAQRYVAEHCPDCYLAATTLDLQNRGRQHLSPGAYTILGLRVAQTALYILGKETYYRGPTVTGITKIDGRTIDVSIRHRDGTDFTPASGISGWEVLTGETHVPVRQVYRQDSETIRISLRAPVASEAEVRYLYGAMPDASNPVLDNSAMSLPLEEYHSE